MQSFRTSISGNNSVTLCFQRNFLKKNWSHYGFYTADVARDKRQPQDTTDSFIPDSSYWES